MRVWSPILSGRVSTKSSSSFENIAQEDNQSLHNKNNENNSVRRDHMNPTRTSAPSCIVFPLDASHFNWDTTSTCETLGKTQPHTFTGGMDNLREDHDLQNKFASLARKVKALEFKKSGQLKSVQDIVCQICETNEHSTNVVQLCLLLRNVFMNRLML